MRRCLLISALAAALLLAALPAEARRGSGGGSRGSDTFKPSRFTDPLDIDNPYYPLEPGMQLVLEGEDADGRHRLVVTVTDVVKRIHGVLSLGVSEQDFADVTPDRPVPRYRLAEDELTFLAQDNRDNVWRLAEYPAEFDPDKRRGGFLGAPNTWVAGQDGAIPGLYMRGKPAENTSSYSLVFAPNAGDEGGIDDRGRILDTDRDGVCVPAGCFDDVLVVEEQNVRVPGDCCQLKYHAPGVGNIRAEALGDITGEFISLVEVRRVSRSTLRSFSRHLLELDRQAYTGDTADLWGPTEPARRR